MYSWLLGVPAGGVTAVVPAGCIGCWWCRPCCLVVCAACCIGWLGVLVGLVSVCSWLLGGGAGR